MEINVAVAAFQAFAFFLVAKKAKHIFRFHVVMIESIKNLTPKKTQIQNTI